MVKGTGFKVEVKPPYRNVAGRFTKATQQLLKDYRYEVQQVGRMYVTAAKREAPSKTGEFKQSISYRTQVTGQHIRLEVLHLEPLGTWIVKGTRKHVITGNPLLVFFWQKGPDGPRVYFFRKVNHPGTKPNAYNERAWKEIRPKAQDKLRKIARDWVVRVT